MPKITFLPVGTTVECSKDESILDVAIDNDVPLQHACGGFCSCTTCHVIVKEGMQNLSPQEEEEKDTIELAEGLTDNSRLACQSRVQGDVTVQIVNLE